MSSEPRTAGRIRPQTVEELAEALRATTGAVNVSGAGTKSSWGGLGAEPQLAVDTTLLSGIVEHAPADLVLTVRAGTRLADIQQELAGFNQWLALDPPEHDATIGGVLSTAASGPHRLRHGTPRDQLIGISVVLADGTVAKSGGKVVKNVAGYDLGKLFTGAYGTLGVIVSATFKMQPLPGGRRVVSIPADTPGMVAAALMQSPAAPAAAEWDGAVVRVLVGASVTAVDTIAKQLAGALGGEVSGDEIPTGFGARPWRAGDLALKLTHRLSASDAVVAAVRRSLPGARLSAHVGSGVVWAGAPAPDPADASDLVDGLRRETASYGGSVVVVDAPEPVKRAVDVWGPVAAVDLMRRVKDRFDPDRRMNPGRFVDDL